MDDRRSLLFREVADLPPVERASVFAARNVPPELRAEVESLLSFDSKKDYLVTACIGQAAEAAVPPGRWAPGPPRASAHRAAGRRGRVAVRPAVPAARTPGRRANRPLLRPPRFGTRSAGSPAPGRIGRARPRALELDRP